MERFGTGAGGARPGVGHRAVSFDAAPLAAPGAAQRALHGSVPGPAAYYPTATQPAAATPLGFVGTQHLNLQPVRHPPQDAPYQPSSHPPHALSQQSHPQHLYHVAQSAASITPLQGASSDHLLSLQTTASVQTASLQSASSQSPSHPSPLYTAPHQPAAQPPTPFQLSSSLPTPSQQLPRTQSLHNNDTTLPVEATVVAVPVARDTGRPTSYTVFQTTNVDPSHPDYQEPVAAALAAAAPPPPAVYNPRSCVTCRRRKVRCDKHMPCGHCVRNKVPCVFPAPGRAPRKPRARDGNGPPAREATPREAELKLRLRKLEDLVRELGGGEEGGRGGRAPRRVKIKEEEEEEEEEEGSGEEGGEDHAAEEDMSGPDDTPSPVATFPLERAEPAVIDCAASPPPPAKAQLPEVVPPTARSPLLHDDGRRGEEGARAQGQRRYVSDGIWTRVNDELESIRRATELLGLDEDEEDDYDYDYEEEGEEEPGAGGGVGGARTDTTHARGPGDHHAFALGYASADFDLEPLRLRGATLMAVWRKYLANVEVWKRILHVPTTGRLVERAAACEPLDAEEEALLFSIVYAAVVSLQEDEAYTLLHASKPDLLVRYRVAVEQALARARFLTASSLTVLQAFVMFVGAVATYDDTRVAWSLTAVLVRVALGMGMHRDGVRYGISPFETEMRRRVWWYIYIVDQRTAEGVGTGPLVAPDSFDTELPTNINDDDISPDSHEMPRAREGHSDCAPALVRLYMLQFVRQLAPKSAAADAPRAAAAKNVPLSSAALGEGPARRMVAYVHDRILSKVHPSQNRAYLMSDLIIQVTRCRLEMNATRSLLGANASPARPDQHERYFVLAYKVILYVDSAYTDPDLRHWQWLFRSFPQWSSIAVTLMEAPRLPWSSMMEMWWEGLHTLLRNMASFGPTGPLAAAGGGGGSGGGGGGGDGGAGAGSAAPDSWLDESKYNSIAWLPLRKLVARARRHRATELVRLRADPDAARMAEAQDEARARNMFGNTPGVLRRFEGLRGRWRVLMGISGGDGRQGVASERRETQQQQQGQSQQQQQQGQSQQQQQQGQPQQNQQQQQVHQHQIPQQQGLQQLPPHHHIPPQQHTQSLPPQHGQQHGVSGYQPQQPPLHQPMPPQQPGEIPPPPQSYSHSPDFPMPSAPYYALSYPSAAPAPILMSDAPFQQQHQQQQFGAGMAHVMPGVYMPGVPPSQHHMQPQQPPPPLQTATFEAWQTPSSAAAAGVIDAASLDDGVGVDLVDGQGAWVWTQPGFKVEAPPSGGGEAERVDLDMGDSGGGGDGGYAFDWEEWHRMSRSTR